MPDPLDPAPAPRTWGDREEEALAAEESEALTLAP